MEKHCCKRPENATELSTHVGTQAFNVCEEQEDGTLFIYNCEYSCQVNFCPVCGYKAKVQIEEAYPCAKCDHELTCGRICDPVEKSAPEVNLESGKDIDHTGMEWRWNEEGWHTCMSDDGYWFDPKTGKTYGNY